MESRDALTVYVRLTAKISEHLALAWDRCQNQAKVTFPAQAFTQRLADIVSCQPTKLGAGLRYINFHDVLNPSAA
jgi:hypothetical protein